MELPRSQTQGASRNTVSVIPYSEIRKIQLKCFGTEDNSKQVQKMELLAKSQERVKKWPNTMKALRKKKDERRFERFKADEMERRRIEEDEAQYQAGVRKEILEKANNQIYENNDRVRAFQGKLLMTDVLQEREAQLELKRYKQELNSMREKMHHEELLEQIAYGEQLEEQKKQQLLQKKKEVKKVISEQHEIMINNQIKVIQNERIEGELNKAKALQLIKEEEDAALERKKKQLQNMDEVKKGNEELKVMKKLEQQKILEEEQRILEYAKKKDQIMEMRRKREDLKFKEKQAQRQKLIDAQIAALEKKVQERDQILNKQIKEAEIKAEEVEKIKQEKRQELVKRISHSKTIAQEQRQKEIEQKKLNDKEFQGYWNQRNDELLKQDIDEKEEVRKRNIQLKKYHIAQMDERQKLREQQILSDMEEQQDIQRKQENENRTFSSWAERAIKEWDGQGKNVTPLLKELINFKQQ